MYAVGYAARQLSSVQQLQALMNNPPLPHGLMAPPDTWLGYCSQEVSCKSCKAKYKPPAQVGEAVCVEHSPLKLASSSMKQDIANMGCIALVQNA
jgi:hypothetical protein